MGQLALGLRSLLVKVAIFFVLAAALAWALGGTLFPRPARVDYPGVEFAGSVWHVRLSVGGNHPGQAWYELMAGSRGEDAEVIGGEYAEAASPVLAGDSLVVLMRRRDEDGGQWVLRQFGPDRRERTEAVADRLAAEQALAGLRAASTAPADAGRP